MAKTINNRSKPGDPLFKETIEKIERTQLINRLQDNALGKLVKKQGVKKEDEKDPEYIEMTAGQIASAKILLDKTVPNLQSTTIDANVNNTHSIENMTPEELDARLKELKNEQ